MTGTTMHLGGVGTNRAFDLVVIGTGEAGEPAAKGARSAGWTVGIIDKRPFGGTCALQHRKMLRADLAARRVGAGED